MQKTIFIDEKEYQYLKDFKPEDVELGDSAIDNRDRFIVTIDSKFKDTHVAIRHADSTVELGVKLSDITLLKPI